jgi:hypothetical protein
MVVAMSRCPASRISVHGSICGAHRVRQVWRSEYKSKFSNCRVLLPVCFRSKRVASRSAVACCFLNEVLKQRARELPAPIQMCDALSRNTPKLEGIQTLLANCLAHGRRQLWKWWKIGLPGPFSFHAPACRPAWAAGGLLSLARSCPGFLTVRGPRGFGG